MTRETYYRQLFTSAAFFNWVVGLGFLFLYRPLLEVLAPQAMPQHTIFLHLFAVVVLCFGVAYFLVSRDNQRYRELIKLGALAKAAIFFLVLSYWLGDLIDWKLVALASGDMLYSLLFIECLSYQRQNSLIQTQS